MQSVLQRQVIPCEGVWGISSTKSSLSFTFSSAWVNPHSFWISDPSQMGKARMQRKALPPGSRPWCLLLCSASVATGLPCYLLYHDKHTLESFSLLTSNLWINDSSSGLLTLPQEVLPTPSLTGLSFLLWAWMRPSLTCPMSQRSHYREFVINRVVTCFSVLSQNEHLGIMWVNTKLSSTHSV